MFVTINSMKFEVIVEWVGEQTVECSFFIRTCSFHISNLLSYFM